MKLLKKTVTMILVLCMFLQAGSSVSALDAESARSLIRTTGDVKMLLRGIEMVPASDGSVQGFLEVRLRGIETTGIGVSLRYDTRYLELSNAVTNEVIKTNSMSVPFFEQNTTNFPAGSFLPVGLGKFESYLPDPQFKTVTMSFLPCGVPGPYYKEVPRSGGSSPDDVDMLFDTTETDSDGCQFGRISFCVVDPAGLMQLSDAERRDVLQVATVKTKVYENNVWNGRYVDKPDVTIGYLNDEGDEAFYDTLDYLDYDLEITTTINGVRLDQDTATVLAPDLYKNGDETDLIDYLNRNLNEVTVTYTGGAELPSTITWGDVDRNFSVTPSYDPKGGEYTVTQKYNDQYSVTAMVSVTPVHVTGYQVSSATEQEPSGEMKTTDRETIVYPTIGSWPVKAGGTIDDMGLPATATPYFDQIVTGKAIRDIAQITAWTAPSGMDLANPAQNTDYIFTGTVDTEALKSALPWISAPTAETVTVTRRIGTQTNKPEGVTAVPADDGKLVIHVDSLGTGEVPEGTDFFVRLPNGQEIPTQAITIVRDATVDPPEGEQRGKGATITVDPVKATGIEDLAQKYVNTGGIFSIAAQEPNKARSEFVDAVSARRENKYVGPASGNTEYTFDYSGRNSSLLPIGLSQQLSKVFTLPDGDVIHTSINGATGDNDGTVRSFKVIDWELQNGSGDPTQPDQVLIYKGELDTYHYENFGPVTNPDVITVTLKVRTQNMTVSEEIAPIEDFYFDKQNVGYQVPDVHEFTVQSTGTSGITGLSVELSDFVFTPAKAESGTMTKQLQGFSVTKRPIRNLDAGGVTTFELATLTELAAGEYTARVTLYSDQTEDLTHFTVHFTVTSQPLYTITVKAEDEQNTGSTVKLLAGSKYYAGEEVKVVVTLGVDGQLSGWRTSADREEIKDEDGKVIQTARKIEFQADSAQSGQYVFTVPALDIGEEPEIEVTAIFTAAITARLRIADIKLMDTSDETGEATFALLDKTYHEVTAFNPAQEEWNVVLPNGTDITALQFKPADPSLDRENNPDFSQDVTVSTFVGIFTPGNIGDDDYYKPTSQISVSNVAPAKCDITISRSIRDDGGTEHHVAYTVHIYQAVANGDLIKLNYGNSPYGLIERQADWSEAEKETAKDYFDTYYRFEEGKCPSGVDTKAVYRPEAWNTDVANAENYDKDPYALFVYGGTDFKDPGFQSVINSLGEPVESDITRTVTVQEFRRGYTSSTDADLQSDFKAVKTSTYNLSQSDSTGDSGFNVSELKDLRVRPGKYEISYRFKDYNGDTVSVDRILFILPHNGDVNVSGGVADSADAALIRGRLVNKLPYDTVTDYAGSNLYQFRVCDVNHDGVVNSIDANCIAANKLSEIYPQID